MSIVTIVGAGMMGSAMSRPARDNHHEVRLVGTPLDRAIIEEVSATSRHIPMKRTLPDGIRCYQIEDLEKALDGTDYVICGVSSFGVDWFAEYVLPRLPLDVPVLSVTKGLLDNPDGSLMTFPRFLKSRLSERQQGRIEFNAIGGPCTSYELADRHQTMVCFCGENPDTLEKFKKLLATDYYHITVTTDIEGVEGCVAMKNAFAVGVSIAVGLAEKLEGKDAYMYNPQAALFGQSCREMARIVRLLGGDPLTAAGIPGAGDLFVTIFGGRTRRLGYLLGLGKSYAEAQEELKGITLESVVIITRAARALRVLAQQKRVDLQDFALLLHLDEIINQGAPVNIPWDRFR